MINISGADEKLFFFFVYLKKNGISVFTITRSSVCCERECFDKIHDLTRTKGHYRNQGNCIDANKKQKVNERREKKNQPNGLVESMIACSAILSSVFVCAYAFQCC